MKQGLIALFERDLLKLKSELLAYQSEENIWSVSGNISNSAGTLVLHLIGNINHFIGAVIGHNGYIRDREAEFSLKDVPRNELVKSIEDTIETIKITLRSFPDEKLETLYPHAIFGEPMTYSYFIIHLYGHLDYHLGQVNYHRRILEF